MDNIVALSLRCSPADHFRIARELQLLGRPLVNQKDEDPIFRTGYIYLRLVLDKDIKRSELTQISTTLNREDKRTLKIGNITIRTKGEKSLWIFE